MASPALRHRVLLAASLAATLFLGGAASAELANLTEVRVGVHGDHTRIVLETDGKAPYIIDATEREVIVHIDAAASAEAVTAKSPHLLWAKVEPTPIGADVRISLKQPADVKALVLTGPHRIVLDLYPKKGGAAPLPAPVLLTEEEPPVTAAAEPPAPEVSPEPEPAAEEATATPGDAETAETAEAQEDAADAASEEFGGAEEALAGGDAAADAEIGSAEEEAAPTAELAEAEPPAADEVGAESATESAPVPVPTERAARRERARTTPPPQPEETPGGLFGSPYLLGAALAALAVLLFVVRRRLAAPSKLPFPEVAEDTAAPFEPPQRAVPVDAPSATGESLFDVEPEALDAPPKEEESRSFLRRAGKGAGVDEETERRIAQLERRIEELVDARDRLERQVGAQTEELRVQRAAIARTQRVLRTVAPRTEDEPSSEPVRG